MFGLPFGQNHMITGMFLFKLYYNVTYRRSDRHHCTY